MAKSAPKPRNFNRLGERTTQPVYFVDAENRISFANQATEDWAGISQELLTSEPLVYSAATGSNASSANGLCPPPSDLNSPLSFFVNRPAVKHDASIEFCAAVAIQIHANNEYLGRLIVVDSSVCYDKIPAHCQQGSEKWHAIVAQAQRELTSKFDLQTLAGDSHFAVRVRQQVAIANRSRSSVLIQGPAGSGKEHLARVLFESSNDHDESDSLIPIHCTIADPQLIQQAIADAKEIGGKNRKHKITLLLIDVDRATAEAQAEIEGFLDLPNFPIRTLATTTVAIQNAVSAGSFLSSLAFKLSPFTIELTALRNRRQDVLPLAQGFLESHNSGRARQLAGFSSKVTELFAEFNWPENVNQLRQVVDAAASNCSGSTVTENDLPNTFVQSLSAMRIGKPQIESIDLVEYLAGIEKELIARAVRQAKGNKTQAAKQLNISRPKLLRRLQFFGLNEFLTDAKSDASEGLIDPSAFEELSE